MSSRIFFRKSLDRFEFAIVFQGDSGGPFTVVDSTNGGRHTLAGIVSWGIGCGNGGVYTRSSAYRSWVEGIIGSTLP